MLPVAIRHVLVVTNLLNTCPVLRWVAIISNVCCASGIAVTVMVHGIAVRAAQAELVVRDSQSLRWPVKKWLLLAWKAGAPAEPLATARHIADWLLPPTTGD